MSGVRLAAVPSLALVALLALPAAAGAQDAADAEARARFQSGSLALDAGRADDALSDFERAYALSHRPQMLYNIGVAAQRGRHRERAIEAYRQYLQDVPDAANRAEVESRIAEVQELIAAEQHTGDAHAPPPDAHARPPARHGDAGPGLAPWALVIGGGVALVAGVVLVAVALADVSSVESPAPGAMWSSVSGAYDQAPVLSTIGFVAAGVGLAAIGAGIAWLLGASHADSGPVHVAIGAGSLSLAF